MKILEIIMEARPDNLGQGLLDKIFAAYQKRDINDQTIPKFNSGLEIASHMFKYSGPQKLIWTAKQYTIDQHFFLHDLDNWKNIFDLFDMPDVRQRLERKDINQYKSIDELKSMILPLVQQRENMTAFDHILEAVDKFVKKGEAEWLFRGTNYSIYHPISFYSSNVLLDLYGGKNHVDVCTVTGKDHFNKQYSPKGFLIYTLTPNNFFVSYINQNDGVDSEFSDKENNHTKYTLEYQLEHFPELRQIIRSQCNDSTSIIVRVGLEQDPMKQYQLYYEAIDKHDASLNDVPIHMRDYEICLMAVGRNGHNIKLVPDHIKDHDMCKIAINHWGRLLEFVPNDLKDLNMCTMAVKQNRSAMRFVPVEFQDQIKQELGWHR